MCMMEDGWLVGGLTIRLWPAGGIEHCITFFYIKVHFIKDKDCIACTVSADVVYDR